jgi:hypothetical protein
MAPTYFSVNNKSAIWGVSLISAKTGSRGKPPQGAAARKSK